MTKLYMEHHFQKCLTKRCSTYLDELCRQYGSTYEGRRKAAQSFLHIRQKAPLVIQSQIVLFPAIANPQIEEVWINYCLIERVEEEGDVTRIIFQDTSELCLEQPYRSILLQIRRCYHYLYALDLHINEQLLAKMKIS